MVTKIFSENSNKYRRLKKGLFGDPSGKIKTFAIISAENPLGIEHSTEQQFIDKFKRWTTNKSKYNKQSVIDFEDCLRVIQKTGQDALNRGSFSYVKIKGSYGAKENTFCIFNIAYEDAKILARDFGQESFFFAKVYSDHSEIAYYETSNCCVSYKLIEITKTVTFEEDAEDFFSKFGFKYRINMNYFGDNVEPIINNGDFEESINPNRSFTSRSIYRRKSFGK